MINQACIVGGGFYGAAIALFLKKMKQFVDITIYEQSDHLLGRASYTNQARVHNGYHYPRSFTTAYRSHANFERFSKDMAVCIKKDFDKYYALARRNSKVTSSQFQRFCAQIEAPILPAEEDVVRLFNPALIEKVFKVEEYAFDASKLRDWFQLELAEAGVKVMLNHRVFDAHRGEAGEVDFHVQSPSGEIRTIHTPLLLNCTYSGLGQIHRADQSIGMDLKHEIAELALINVPPIMRSIGITVMDGPFFSVMPFPARDCHSLSHVRYTPHRHWRDQHGISPYKVLDDDPRETRVDRMIRDANRYLPALALSEHVDSLFEIKTVLIKNETDDGRPILVREDPHIHGLISVLGSKIDNIYDILESIDSLVEF
jgi:glycine/D-amino acid oxidase-like deaminating enzyme